MNQKPPYNPIKQKQYCCVPACLAMILTRRKITCASQEEIGYDLGLTVPKKSVQFFTKVRIGKKPTAGYGTQVHRKKYSISNYFSKRKISLKEKYYPVGKIKNIKEFIVDNIKNHNDLIVCFNNKKLYGNGDYGHVSLIQKININKDIIALIDPEKNVPNMRKVTLKTLIKAMKFHGKNKRGGFWLIYKDQAI